MNWSSVKNLLITILLAANLFLVYNIARQVRSGRYIDEKTVSDAVEYLEQNGFHVATEAVPLKRFKASVFEMAYNDEYYTDVAAVLTGSERELLLSLPDGGFSITSSNGSSVELGNEFDFVYSANDTFSQKAYIDITPDSFSSFGESGEEHGGASEKSLKKKTVDFLEACFADESVLTTDIEYSFRDPASGLDYVLAVQKLGGYRVYSHYAVCVFDGDSLIGSYGRWFFFGSGTAHYAQLTDQVNVLLADFEEQSIGEGGDISRTAETFSAVTGVQACYVTYWNAGKTALYFIPAWQVSHMDAAATVYNATSGAVYSTK